MTRPSGSSRNGGLQIPRRVVEEGAGGRRDGACVGVVADGELEAVLGDGLARGRPIVDRQRDDANVEVGELVGGAAERAHCAVQYGHQPPRYSSTTPKWPASAPVSSSGSARLRTPRV